jgi:hypothetical protein
MRKKSSLLDNHESHLSIKIIDLDKKNGIVMFTFPPHTSHKFHPLDRTVFSPLKKYYNKVCNEWLLQHPGSPLTIYNVAECFGKAYPLAFTPTNIQNGFKVSGIWPLNENIFGDDEFLSSYVTDRPLDENAHTDIETSKNTSTSANTPINISNINLRPIINTDTNIQADIALSEPSTSSAGNQPGGGISELLKSPEMVRPFPAAPPRRNIKAKNRRGKTRVLTDTPEKQELDLLAEKKRQKAVTKTKKTVKRKVLNKDNISSTEDETDLILEIDGSGDGVNDENICVGCGENYFGTSSN